MRAILFTALLMLCASAYSVPMKITWEDKGMNSVYVIERSVDGSPFIEVGRADESDEKFVDDNVEPLVLYKYRVKAVINGVVVYSDIEEGMTAVR